MLRTLLPTLALTLPIVAVAAAPPARSPDFNREVRPILSRHCFKCHGPDDKQRQAGLRLDDRAAALAKHAFVPGKAEASELVRRMDAKDGSIMPPVPTQNPLTPAEKATLRAWIAAGAKYEQHWAFVPPKQVPLPAVKRKDWCRNPIDNFVLTGLEKEGLQPSAAADRFTLCRRVYLDLIGVPPTPEEADAFISDKSPKAYEKLVDKLLASPHYGERWARRWLDLARYSDTNGYEKDRPRTIWPYRDWVIKSLNADLPFDRFTIDQIAGDLLPNPTPEQIIATGFHRNTMRNEEGGIDPLEFRYYSMVDRTNTTATTWLGLTLGCAQCHTHKFDPIPHREYYQVMACMDNTEEPEFPVPDRQIAAKRAEIEKQARALEASLADRFPAAGQFQFQVPRVASVSTRSGAKGKAQEDGSVLISGVVPESDSYTVHLESSARRVEVLRLEALTHPSLGSGGPGRTPHGNFVLTEMSVMVAPKEHPEQARPAKLARGEADFSQDGFSAGAVFDGNQKTGWAIAGPNPLNVNRTATFYLEKPIEIPGDAIWTVKLDQEYGGHHTLGRFRISLGTEAGDPRPLEVRRKEHLEQRYREWLADESKRAVKWTVLRPTSAKANEPILTIQPDNSVLARGDITKRDVYDLTFSSDLKGITAIRVEALPDPSLPRGGPGRVYYEGPFGDFFLSEITMAAGGKPQKITRATESAGSPATGAIDNEPQTGWSLGGAGIGQAHTAVFGLAEPLEGGQSFSIQMVFERYYAASLGRFRISVTTDARAEARLPADVEEILTTPGSQRTSAQQERLLKQFLASAPELAPEREEIRKLRTSEPEPPLALVMRERPEGFPRATYVHNRGEFLQPKEKVEPGVLSALGLPAPKPLNRLTFAKWLVDNKNPLTARVTVNRQWAALFGTGLVKTTEDFGYQGEPPSHPELLDWLAVEFMKQGWSLKKLHKLIVTSAAYQQSSRVTPELLKKDPQNRLISRGPSVRLEAELVRDTLLKTSGLLSEKMYGPSVFPPQPPGVTTEGAYGPLQWKVSDGEDRYRRGLYTFSKRSAPYAMFLAFDAPSGEACVARRDSSDTALQALTLLNDEAFVEGAQALGRTLAAREGTVEARIEYLFRRCVTRPPTAEERQLLVGYLQAQRARLAKGELNADTIAGNGEGDAKERAAWTLLARSLLNLDEVVTKR